MLAARIAARRTRRHAAGHRAEPISCAVGSATAFEARARAMAAARFHARYGGDEALIDIATGGLIAGSLPPRATRLLREWADMYRDELQENWEGVRRRQTPERIAPLR